MKVEKLSSNRVRFTFDVTPGEFEHGLDHAFEQARKDVEIKGFRKGKVPRNIYEQKFGVESLYENALNHVLHHKFQEAHSHPDHQIVGEPTIDLAVDKIKRGEAFPVHFEVAVKPDVELGEYLGIEAKTVKADVTDSEVDFEIRQLLKKEGTLEPKTEGTLDVGDTAIFDFEGFLDDTPFPGGKADNYELEIGSKSFIPGFEDQMVGLKAGEESDIKVTFPENYHAAELAGKEVTFKIKLHEIKVMQTGELNDVWVQSLAREGVRTVDELKADVRKELEAKKEGEAKNVFTNEVVGKVLDNAKVDIPQEMIDAEAEQQIKQVKSQAKQYNMEYEMFLSLNGIDAQTFEQQAAVEAKKRVRTTLVFEAIALKEGLKAEDEAVDAKFKDIAAQHKMKLTDVKKYVPRAMIEGDLTNQMAYQLVVDKAKKI
ncbi:MAG: trigger factor [Acholeplasmataceae bacterium]|nr:MAG: trigger factor [Acholeplasmataceae bacterium]